MNCFQASPPRSSLRNLQRILRAMQTRCSAICSPGELCLAFHSKSVLLFNLAISSYSRSVRKLLGSLTRKSSQTCRFHSVIFSNIVAVIVVKKRCASLTFYLRISSFFFERNDDAPESGIATHQPNVHSLCTFVCLSHVLRHSILSAVE